MNPQYWTALQHTPGWDLFVGIGIALGAAFVPASFTAYRSVKGSHRRHIAASIVRGLGVPLAASDLFTAVVHVAAGQYFDAFLSVVSAFATASLVRKYSGDDDFWSDTSKKLKRRLKSLTASRRRPAITGAGA